MPDSVQYVKDISIFSPRTSEAVELYSLNIYFIIASSAILILVIGLLIFISFKFRTKQNQSEPKQVYSNRLLEIFMVGVPFIMVSYFFYLTVKTMKDTEPQVVNEKPTVVITGKQWWWDAHYPGGAVTANEIHLPANEKVLLKLQAADVIHDWWLPSFGPKMDMIPGVTNYLWLNILKPGTYVGACNEFCGRQHAGMRIKVIAQTRKNYDKWLAENAKPAIISNDENIKKGELLFSKNSCGSCHSIRGTGANGNVGPDLTHIANRGTLLSGLVENNKENLTRLINNPQALKPGVNMPRFIYTKDSIAVLVDYLSSLK
ncbi:MAG: cytochrome c oxidase subunit II [Pedobacter sp.]|nr:cytochrome c oxidase subunit II [Pedobacter sp.]